VRIAIHIRKNVLALGVGAILQRIPYATVVPWSPTGAADVDVVIVHESDVDDLHRRGFGDSAETPKMLVIVQEADGVGVFENGRPPDGVLVEDELSEASLVDALRRTLNGEMPIPASLTRELIGRVGSVPAVRQRGEHRLTPREAETLVLLAEGLGNKQIARRLHISNHGVKRIVASLLLKLDSPNRTTAVVRAIQDGLVSVDNDSKVMPGGEFDERRHR
jgi:two-component system nitrate/nitrite response regulator NarL